jgi:hypothetical protein
MVRRAMSTDPDGLLVGPVKAADPGQPQDQSVDDLMQTGAFRDPAGNLFGVYHRAAG